MTRRYKRRIDWYLTQEMINQVYLSGLEYAFVSKNFKQITPLVYCKDFLQDALQGHLCKIRRKIHGFLYDPAVHKPIYTDRLRIIIACSKDRHFRDRMPGMLDFLHQIEDKLGIKETSIRECSSPPPKYAAGGIWLLDSHKRWMMAPPMISMYTLMLRLGLVHQLGETPESTMLKIEMGLVRPYGSKDKSQMKSAKRGIVRILRLGDQRIFGSDIHLNYPSFVPLCDMHDEMGIIGFARKRTAYYIPRWHKEP